MKKTLLVTIDFWPKVGGVADYYFNLCRNLEKEKIAVLTMKEIRNPASSAGEQKLEIRDKEDIYFKIYREKLLTRWWWPKWLMMGRHIRRVVAKEKIEMLWVGEILPTGTVVYYLNKILKLPYVVSCHGKDLLLAKKIRRKEIMARKILQKAKYVTVNSKYTFQLVRAMGIDESKIKIIYPGVEINKEQLTLHSGGQARNKVKEKLLEKYDLFNKRIILSVGRLVARKGFDQVIMALPHIVSEVPKVVYVIAGEGEEKNNLNILTFKHLNNNKDKVIFAGRVSDEEKWAWLELCDVLVMPSRESEFDAEGFGIVYLEANSFGKPVVAGRSGGASEAVADGETGILVDPLDSIEIAEAIIKILKDKELAGKLGRQGRFRVEKEFLWQQRKQIMEEIFS